MKLSEGCYLLRSNVTDWSGEELWRAYIQLTGAEGSVSTPPERPGHEDRLAPERTPRTSSHPRLLSCLTACGESLNR